MFIKGESIKDYAAAADEARKALDDCMELNGGPKYHYQMNADEKVMLYRWLHSRLMLLDARVERIKWEADFVVEQINEIEREWDGHDINAALWSACKCKWCVNGWTLAEGKSDD